MTLIVQENEFQYSASFLIRVTPDQESVLHHRCASRNCVQFVIDSPSRVLRALLLQAQPIFEWLRVIVVSNLIYLIISYDFGFVLPHHTLVLIHS